MSRSIFNPLSALFLLSLISLFGCIIITSDARADPMMLRDYWKTRMKGGDEPMPKAIEDLIRPFNFPALDDHPTVLDGFVRDFKTNPNVIIYHMSSNPLHDHAHSQESKPSH